MASVICFGVPDSNIVAMARLCLSVGKTLDSKERPVCSGY